jgi:uncharacterized protein YuzE
VEGGEKMNNKKYHYDKESDSLFIYLEEGEEESFEEIAPGINIELDKDGKIIGIEILKASRFSENLKKTPYTK